ncbi:MAG: TetR/AcrR family transcriptional regulator [Deltaproteobacteria bacterium]|nr:TetR/AcrR family transcriptional regulator [Deltaproteobacteria bacterium]MBW1923158.1 TetR/AcrR family transcriptional regulator [Deltaproteobacteria bacterium]MBW1949279.1 TetR/AcrR family transcriptional regulator [Deltaproteobacteria bacterium]MBW2007713.1 TetR/AcrR family transcriptional regulator [Deltaproteobacteria bacterium]MBW2103845.1 TetR/AcrR family transcriptional regulator [Deltaproteobacteria bacterium]
MIKTNIKDPERVRKRQEQICRGAMKVFRRKGFHATSMREIAAATGISLGNIYDYIEKKEDILFLVHNYILSRIYRQFEEGVKASDNPVEQLRSVMRGNLQLTIQLREEILFIYTETKSLEKRFLTEVLKKEAEFVARFETLIRQGVDRGVFRCDRPGLFANIIVYLLTIFPLRGWNILRTHTEEELIEEVTRLILAGLGV